MAKILLLSMLYIYMALAKNLKPPVCYQILQDGIENESCNYVEFVNNRANSLNWRTEDVRLWKQFHRKKDDNSSMNHEFYTNVTIIFPMISDVGTLAIEHRNIIIWQLEPKMPDEFPMVFKIAFIPFQKNDFAIRKYSTKIEDICEGVEGEDCIKLNHSYPTLMRTVNRTTLKFSLELLQVHINVLYIELLESSCSSISCENGSANCKNSTLEAFYYYLIKPSTFLYIEGLKIDHYYCARVLTIRNCCPIATEVIYLEGNKSLESRIFVKPYETISTNLIIFGAVLLGVLVLLSIGITHFKVCRIKRKSLWKPIDQETDLSSNQECYSQLRILNNMVKKDVQVLLIYPKGDEVFRNLIVSFQNLLKLYVPKIWDIHGEETIDQIDENLWVWLEHILKIDGLHIVIVETDKTREWLSTGTTPTKDLDFYQERLPYFAISRIREDPRLSTDYNRLFRVRFDVNIEKVHYLVPLTCYEMPQHLSHLIEAITGLTTVTLPSDRSSCIKEIANFYNDVNSYQKTVNGLKLEE